jgi:uncharacterized membrane protein YfcA
MCSKCFKEEQESKGVTSKPTASVSNAAPAVFSYYKRGEIDIKNGLIICAFYALLAGLGAKLNVLFSQKLTLNLAGVLQLIAAGLYFYQGYKKK